MTSGVPKNTFSLIWGSRPMVPMVPFKETTSCGRMGFSMGGHSLGWVWVGFGLGWVWVRCGLGVGWVWVRFRLGLG